MRPVHVRVESSTRGHVLVVMLAHRLIQELQHCWAGESLTVEEGIKQLSSLCVKEVMVNGAIRDQLVPEGQTQAKWLIELAKVEPLKNSATPEESCPLRRTSRNRDQTADKQHVATRIHAFQMRKIRYSLIQN